MGEEGGQVKGEEADGSAGGEVGKGVMGGGDLDRFQVCNLESPMKYHLHQEYGNRGVGDWGI
jgi:hypothetical protein